MKDSSWFTHLAAGVHGWREPIGHPASGNHATLRGRYNGNDCVSTVKFTVGVIVYERNSVRAGAECFIVDDGYQNCRRDWRCSYNKIRSLNGKSVQAKSTPLEQGGTA